jgi:hypothetical protein
MPPFCPFSLIRYAPTLSPMRPVLSFPSSHLLAGPGTFFTSLPTTPFHGFYPFLQSSKHEVKSTQRMYVWSALTYTTMMPPVLSQYPVLSCQLSRETYRLKTESNRVNFVPVEVLSCLLYIHPLGGVPQHIYYIYSVKAHLQTWRRRCHLESTYTTCKTSTSYKLVSALAKKSHIVNTIFANNVFSK